MSRKARPLLAAALLASATACGVEPSPISDAGPAPVISGPTILARIYLVRNGKLWPTTAAVRSPHVSDVMQALFNAKGSKDKGIGTELSGLTLSQVQLVRYSAEAGGRNDPDNTLGLRMRLFVSGRKISRLAMAQIICTARLSPEIWAVEIAHVTPKGTGSLKTHTCREYWELATGNDQLPP